MEAFVIDLRTYAPVLDVDPLEVTVDCGEVTDPDQAETLRTVISLLAAEDMQTSWVSGDMAEGSTWRTVRYRCGACNALMDQAPCLSELCRDARAAARGWNRDMAVVPR